MKKLILVINLVLLNLYGIGQNDSILLFVSHEQTYYSEYVVMKEALESSGFYVDVRNASGMQTSTYMTPVSADIQSTANSLSGSSFADFTSQYLDMFGSDWNAALNSTPQFIDVNGSIQDVQNMDDYEALVVVGGIGALDYRVDGTYNTQGVGTRLITAQTVQDASEKLNDLALESLLGGKPVMAQCHGASIPVYWRIPNTMGPGEETLGYSLLKDNEATGFPESATGPTLAGLNVSHRVNDRVTISSPHSSLNDNGTGDYKIITTRDWYPQTVAYAARSLVNILESYPDQSDLTQAISVLIIHGGAIDSLDCGPGNTSNDVPCNYNGVPNLPADYRHLESLLNANSANDSFNFQVFEDDISDSNSELNLSTQDSILNQLLNYDVVIFFKHWSFYVSDDLQNAMVEYADQGNGILALHHGLYNDIRPGFDKDILVNDLFGIQSHEVGWGADTAQFEIYNTNYGHFISTYGINHVLDAATAPSTWTTNSPPSGTNLNNSYYHRFTIFDEIYTNMEYVSGQTFGRGVNEITPIFANNFNPANDLTHTTGMIKQFNQDLDENVGKLAYFSVGERKESININHIFGQVVRNSVVWLAFENNEDNSTVGLQTAPIDPTDAPDVLVFPNPANENLTIENLAEGNPIRKINILDLSGKLINSTEGIESSIFTTNISALKSGIYVLEIHLEKSLVVKKFSKK